MTAAASPWPRRGRLSCSGLIVALLGAGYIAFKSYEHRFEQGRFPAHLAVTSTIYKAEESWGFGPGGNETGLIVYRLDKASSRRLEQEGPLLTSDHSIRAAMGRASRDYFEWKRTPIDKNERQWSGGYQTHGSRASSLILRYLDQYGFGIAINSSVAGQIDKTLSNTGAYYAYGRGGSLIVIAPKEKRLIFAYAG